MQWNPPQFEPEPMAELTLGGTQKRGPEFDPLMMAPPGAQVSALIESPIIGAASLGNSKAVSFSSQNQHTNIDHDAQAENATSEYPKNLKPALAPC